jgi:hypothetical protein
MFTKQIIQSCFRQAQLYKFAKEKKPVPSKQQPVTQAKIQQ